MGLKDIGTAIKDSFKQSNKNVKEGLNNALQKEKTPRQSRELERIDSRHQYAVAEQRNAALEHQKSRN